MNEQTQPSSVDTIVTRYNDTHCWLEHESAGGAAFDRLTGAVDPKNTEGTYLAIHTTNYPATPCPVRK